MLGTLRFTLAVLVVMNHLWLPTANKLGAHAVAGFYVISGYLMTRVVHEIYHGPDDFRRYLVNRFLCIFPLYWGVVAATALALAALPNNFAGISPTIQLNLDLAGWVANLTLWWLPQASIVLVPPAWSLTIEWTFYLLIGLGFSRRPRLVVAWWLASVAYTATLLITAAPFSARYTPPAAASLFFSTGALLYHLRGRLRWRTVDTGSWLPLLAAFAVMPLLIERCGGDLRMTGFYGSYAVFIPLFMLSLGAPSARWFARHDALLGDLAYPIFLTHYFAAGVTNVLARNALVPFGTAHFLCSLTACVALSFLIVRFIDPTIGRLRDAIRPAASPPVDARGVHTARR